MEHQLASHNPEIKLHMFSQVSRECKRTALTEQCECFSLTIRAVDAGMLVVAEEEAMCALTLVAPHGVETHLLASTVVVCTLVHICWDWTQRERGSAMVE